MKNELLKFNEADTIHKLKHYLPAQAPLKDFIHHNTLHAFQDLKFNLATLRAAKMFGYKVSLSIYEFRELYKTKKISHDNLVRIIVEKKGEDQKEVWMDKVILKDYDLSNNPRIGKLREVWKNAYRINLDAITHPKLFRIICSYLDQGIAIWKFPTGNQGLLSAVRELERHSSFSFFSSERVKNLFRNTHCEIMDLLKLLVGDEALYEQYIFDQQFAHQGWSGMVSSIEDNPSSLLEPKKITVNEFIILECLLELDALDQKTKNSFTPLANHLIHPPVDLFSELETTELSEVISIWQEAYEQTYYDEVLSGLQHIKAKEKLESKNSFQAMFCIDDRECSLRRYIEDGDANCNTFGTPGFFGVEFYFKPEHGKFYSKLCPAPLTPKYLIKEINSSLTLKKDAHLSRNSHSLIRGWLISQTLGFWSALRLFLNIFRPRMNPANASSFHHMDRFSHLTIEHQENVPNENNLQIGFTLSEMTERVAGLLKSIGLIKDFAPLVYVIGHGSSSINNPHYAGYDCGACSGRPGSVNARVICNMANKKEVRKALKEKGIDIPESTQFVGGLHDTSRDDITFYDENTLTPENVAAHKINSKVFEKALDLNSKERSRRFATVNTKLDAHKIRLKMRIRSVSIFEPRPELNHATNTLCIVGRRAFTKGLYLDRRAFMNSYDYRIDLDGSILTNIMKPLGPVCGGINLEYFFSRVDNHKLGAGTKLPHNVMGLFAVANGIDGDLRPGLPSQMIEVHDPMRLLIIVEHFPNVVLKVIKSVDAMYEWFENEWINLVAVNPETGEQFMFKNGEFQKHDPIKKPIETIENLGLIIEAESENLPVYLLK